jgi:hypothetical protein
MPEVPEGGHPELFEQPASFIEFFSTLLLVSLMYSFIRSPL